MTIFMPYYIKYFILFVVTTNLIISGAQSQENINIFKDSVCDKDIKTARIHQSGWEISYPFYELNSDKHLIMSFDDLQEDPRDFEYRIVHCDQNWHKSDLLYSEYMDGFQNNHMEDYEMSVNTFIPYTHYELELPNDDVNFRISGNYAVVVYETAEPDRPLLIKRFMVVEHKLKINADVKQPVMSLYRDLGQDVKFSLETNNMQFNNIYDDLDVCIVQNYQWETAQSGFNPDFVNNDEIVFHRDDQAVFKAINEYRRFSLRDLEYTDNEVAEIKFDDPHYYVRLATDTDNQFRQYLDRTDFNGRYAVSNREGWESLTDSDYVKVKFSLPARSNLLPATVHVYGELTQWQCNENSEMSFNSENMQYETTLLLKQAVYNYRYVLKEESGDVDHMRFEGSHQQTENDYMIIVYFHDRRLGADRIIGFDLINSRN
ncbi:MAG: DUF5103 domain-containing protein [Bacteroidota bacterium]